MAAALATQGMDSHAQTSMSATMKHITAMPMPTVQTTSATMCALAMMDTLVMDLTVLISMNARVTITVTKMQLATISTVATTVSANQDTPAMAHLVKVRFKSFLLLMPH